jgi:hypothetical protein
MKLSLVLSLIFIQLTAYAKVEICHRKAQIAFGLVDHYWLKTDLKNAGMGSGKSEGQIGDKFEGPGTKVFVIDHTNQIPEACKESNDHIEECINQELEEGKYLGRFTPINNCQSYVKKVLKKCETPEFKELEKVKSEYLELNRKKNQNDLPLSENDLMRLNELEQKYGF